MIAYTTVKRDPCANCGESPGGHTMSNTAWGHNHWCCSEECGQAFGRKLEGRRKRKFRPGEKAPIGGLYEIVGLRGGQTGWQRCVSAGDKFPPTPEPNKRYRLLREWRT